MPSSVTANSASGFNFLSYAVDKFEISVADDKLGLSKGNFSEQNITWKIMVEVLCPQFLTLDKTYICGLSCRVEAFVEIDVAEPTLTLNGRIRGFFKPDEGSFSGDKEEAIAKIQAPTILLPYLRGTITTFLANAGYGSIIFPLINLHDIAKESLDNVSIEIINS